MLTLTPITSGIKDGRHQHYPTPGLAPHEADDSTTADDTACRLLMAYQPISYLRLDDADGIGVRTYRRCDFFMKDSPLRHVHHRVVEARLAGVREVSQSEAE